MNHLPDPLRVAPLLLCAFVCLSLVLGPAESMAAGFEVGEHTARSTARGGTGVASKTSPAAVYFNPALLTAGDGWQVQADGSLIDYNLWFRRTPFDVPNSDDTRTYQPVRNRGGLQPLPSFGASWDLGTDDFAVGVGVYSPHAYGTRCFGPKQNGECQARRQGAARRMLVSSNLIQIHAMAGLGYRLELADGILRLGASGLLAYQDHEFKLAILSAVDSSGPWDEDPSQEAVFTASNLSSVEFNGIFGVSWEKDGFRVGASYRPPFQWESTGTAELQLPEDLRDQNLSLTDEGVTFRSGQAGSLRLGWAYEWGAHPGRPARPKYEFAVDGVWENWSVVENFQLSPAGNLQFQDNEVELPTIYQRKNWRDTFSLRLGGSWGAAEWLTVHAGGSLETAAQPAAYTNLVFSSWERYSGTTGASFHATDWLDVDVAFMHVHSPTRRVDNGEVYQQIPLHGCRGPDFEDDACPRPGRPPGNPQNEGVWSANYNIATVGARMQFR